jgi:hypothetical protein
MEKKYIIFNVIELTNINFNEVLETSSETVRKSVDNTKTFVNWSGDTPNFIETLTTKEGPYSIEEMLVILSGNDWFKPIIFQS